MSWCPPEDSRACPPVRRRRVQLRPSPPVRPSVAASTCSRHPVAPPEHRPTGPAHPRPPPLRAYPCPARGRVWRRNDDRPPPWHRGRRIPGRPRTHPRRSRTDRLRKGVRDPGRDTSADRPGIRAAREHGIVDALTDAGINCWADKGHQGAGGTVTVSYRGRWENALRRSAGRQSGSCKDPCTRRAGRRHPQDLAPPPLAAMLHDPHHPARSSRPPPSSRRLRVRLERAHRVEQREGRGCESCDGWPGGVSRGWLAVAADRRQHLY